MIKLPPKVNISLYSAEALLIDLITVFAGTIKFCVYSKCLFKRVVKDL